MAAAGVARWAAVLGIAWGGSAVATLLFTEAIRHGNPTSAVLLQKSQPVFAALAAWVLLGEPLGTAYWKRLTVALAGAYLISFGSAPLAPIRHLALADPSVLAIAAAALWGSSTVLGRFVLDRLSFAALTALRIVLATPLLALIALRSPGFHAAHYEAHYWLTLLALALVPGLLALLSYYRGLKRCQAAKAAVAELTFPAMATLLNWTFLGARLTVVQGAGFALLWLAIFSLQRGHRDTP